MENDLKRFIKAQENSYDQALLEIKSGCKRGHWMWYIFPQYRGLGFSETTIYYAFQDIDEAKSYFNHPILGSRLKQITTELLQINENDASKVFESPDDLKLKSCMTLFSVVDTSEENIFKKVLDKFFNGYPDNKTLTLLKK